MATRSMTAGGKKLINPEHLFDSAESYRKAAYMTGHSKVAFEHPSLIFPTMSHACFALELYLKCLLTIEGKHLKGHNLKVLFMNLSKNTRDTLEKRHNDVLDRDALLQDRLKKQNLPIDLMSLLEEAKDFYSIARYVFEDISDRGAYGFNLWNFTENIRHYIIGLNPHWLFPPQVRPTSQFHWTQK